MLNFVPKMFFKTGYFKRYSLYRKYHHRHHFETLYARGCSSYKTTPVNSFLDLSQSRMEAISGARTFSALRVQIFL